MSDGRPCNIYEIRTSVYHYVHSLSWVSHLFGLVLEKVVISYFFCSSNMLKFLKVSSAAKPISLGCELAPKPKKRLVIPGNEEPSSGANLFSQQLWKLYDSCHYWIGGSSKQKAFHKDYALRKARKDLGAWFLELQAEVSDLVKLAKLSTSTLFTQFLTHFLLLNPNNPSFRLSFLRLKKIFTIVFTL